MHHLLQNILVSYITYLFFRIPDIFFEDSLSALFMNEHCYHKKSQNIYVNKKILHQIYITPNSWRIKYISDVFLCLHVFPHSKNTGKQTGYFVNYIQSFCGLTGSIVFMIHELQIIFCF